MLLAIVVIVFLGMMYLGYKRGLINTVCKVVISVAAIVLALVGAPILSELICENTRLDDTIQEAVYNQIEEKVGDMVQDKLPSVNGQKVEAYVSQLMQKPELTEEEQKELVERLELPEFIKNALNENNNIDIKKALGATDYFEYIAIYVSKAIIKATASVIIFIVIMVGGTFIYTTANIASHLPVLKGANRLAGLALGFVEGLVIVWMLLAVVAIIINTEIGRSLYSQIDSNKFLSMLYDYNIFMKYVTRL